MGSEFVGYPHLLELVDRARSEAVAAGLRPRVVLFLDDEHVYARAGEPVGRGGSGWPAPDDVGRHNPTRLGRGGCRSAAAPVAAVMRA